MFKNDVNTYVTQKKKSNKKKQKKTDINDQLKNSQTQTFDKGLSTNEIRYKNQTFRIRFNYA